MIEHVPQGIVCRDALGVWGTRAVPTFHLVPLQAGWYLEDLFKSWEQIDKRISAASAAMCALLRPVW